MEERHKGLAPGDVTDNVPVPGPVEPEEDRQPLDVFFAPRAVAVIGASDRLGSVGRAILWNLISSPFGGTVYAVNPNRHNVLGIRAYPDVRSLPEPIDLAMVLTPAATVPGVIDECIEAGIPGAIIISAGFRETGEAGRALEEEVRRRVKPGQIRIIGPNSLGVMNPVTGLNAAYASTIARKGSVGFISQSGALCASVLDWSLSANVGFSAFVSFGSMVDVDWADLIHHLGNDPYTKSIVLYVQSIGDARSFLSAVREVALAKPIILLKAGHTQEAGQVAKATGYYAGFDSANDAVLSAALRRSGVLRVDDIDSMFSMAEVLAKQPRPGGRRMAIVSNAASPGILATDALVRGGGELAELADETYDALTELLPEYWRRANPVDLVADADAERYAKAVEIVSRDPNCDGLLVVLTPQVNTDAQGTAEALTRVEGLGRKPVLASWMGGEAVAGGKATLSDHGIPVFHYPDAAASVFNAMWRYSYNIQGMYETPRYDVGHDEEGANHAVAERVIRRALDAGQTVLPPSAARELLRAYGIALVEPLVARDADEAVFHANRIGYPVVLKRLGGRADQRADAGGVLLDLAGDDTLRLAYKALEAFARNIAPDAPFEGLAVQPVLPRDGYRVVMGSAIDPQFGPFLYFGPGGQMEGVFRERALGLPPLNSTLACRLMEQTRIYNAFMGKGGCKAVDIAQLEHLLVRFSYLVAEQRWVREIEINPILVAPDRLAPFEARIVLHAPETPEDALPKLAIRPYPSEYVGAYTMKNGQDVTIRPIRPEDESLMVRFHETLSKDTVYYRYLRLLAYDQRVKHERLSQMCFLDYDRAMALVAVERDPAADEPRILAVVRMAKLHGTADADFAIVVSDDAHGLGLGSALMTRLAEVGRAEGLRRIVGTVLPENRPMLSMCRKLGFRLDSTGGDEVSVILDL